MNKFIKTLLICTFVLVVIAWLSYANPSQSAPSYKSDDYVGSEACKDCHEDQFKAFSHTTHSRLSSVASWKGKVTG